MCIALVNGVNLNYLCFVIFSEKSETLFQDSKKNRKCPRKEVLCRPKKNSSKEMEERYAAKTYTGDVKKCFAESRQHCCPLI